MENFVIILCLFLVLPFGASSVNINIKTFYDTDLDTSHIFEKDNGVNELCNYFSEFYEEKNDKNLLPKCIRFKETQTLYCHEGMENFRNYTNKPKLERIKDLVICYHNSTDFDAKLLSYFHQLKNLFIGYSSFVRFKGILPHLEHLKYINITKTELKIIKGDLFSDLPAIRSIDLRSNQLNIIEKLHLSTHHDVRLWLHGNQWNCSQAKIIKWLAYNDTKIEFKDRDKLNCSDPKFSKRPLVRVMNFKIDLWRFCKDESNDLRNCSCHVSYVRQDDVTRDFLPVASVNCSSKGFYNFPRTLPPFTNALFIDHNYISSLDALCFKNSTYTSVHDIYLDYNRISDAMVLDNCAWFEQFRALSLRGNFLEKIPVFGFFNSFEKSQHALKLYLSENPWDCSCTFAPRLLKLCQKYKKLIVDQKNIKCHNAKNDPDLDGRAIMELTLLDVCKINKNLNMYEIASIIFSILIVIVAVNFIIDYYRYKNFGKLPWIVLNTPFF